MIRKTTIFFLFLALLAIAHAAKDPKDNTGGDGNGGNNNGKPVSNGNSTTAAPEVGHSEETKDGEPASDVEKKPTNNTASAAQYAFGASLVLLATL